VWHLSDLCQVFWYNFYLNLSLLLCEPTPDVGNTLDLILTDIPDHISNVDVRSAPPLSINPSDHCISTFNVHTPIDDTHSQAMTSFDFNKGD